MRLRIHPSARKHGIADADIRHAVKHAMSIDDQEDNLRLYLGPGRDATLLEVATVVRGGRRVEMVIHAMTMRAKYRSFLPGE
jgi:hypothetical protein